MRLSGAMAILGAALVVASFVAGEPADPYQQSWAWPLVSAGVLTLVAAGTVGLVAGSPAFQQAVIVTLTGGFGLAMGLRLVIPYDPRYAQTWSPMLGPLLVVAGVALATFGVARGRAEFRSPRTVDTRSTGERFFIGFFWALLLVPATGFLLAFGVFRFGGYCPGNCLAPVWQDAALFGGLALSSLAFACIAFVLTGIVQGVASLLRRAVGI